MGIACCKVGVALRAVGNWKRVAKGDGGCEAVYILSRPRRTAVLGGKVGGGEGALILVVRGVCVGGQTGGMQG